MSSEPVLTRDPTCRAPFIKEDFSHVPSTYIVNQLTQHRTLYEAYLAIEKADREAVDSPNPAFQRLKKPRRRNTNDMVVYPELKRELDAVRRRRDKEDGKFV